MMKPHPFRSAIFCTLLASALHAQDSTVTWKSELSFRVLYNYSSLAEKPHYDSWSYHPYWRTHTLTLKIGLAQAVIGDLWTIFEPTYSLQHRSMNFQRTAPANIIPPISVRSEWSHKIGILAGAIYSFDLSARTQLLFGAKAGLLWSRYSESVDDHVGLHYWTSPEHVLPQILVGIRAFSGESWALLFQVEYSWVPNYEGQNRYTHSQVDVGLGVGFYR